MSDEQGRPYDVEKARQAEALAAQCLSDLCHARRRWEMHIPIQDDDPDVILYAALAQLRAAIKEVEQKPQQLEAQLAAATERAEAAEHKLNDVLPGYIAQCAQLLEDNDALRQRAEAAEAKLAAVTKQAAPTDEDALTLSNLQEDTNDVLDSLDKTLVKGAINWADLRCVSAEKVHGQRGREWYRVEIEEAAPGEEALIAAVAAGLAAKGWYMSDIEISTEW